MTAVWINFCVAVGVNCAHEFACHANRTNSLQHEWYFLIAMRNNCMFFFRHPCILYSFKEIKLFSRLNSNLSKFPDKLESFIFRFESYIFWLYFVRINNFCSLFISLFCFMNSFLQEEQDFHLLLTVVHFVKGISMYPMHDACSQPYHKHYWLSGLENFSQPAAN